MKKGVLLKTLYLSVIFGCLFTCFFGYVISTNTVYAVNKFDNIKFQNIQQEEVINNTVEQKQIELVNYSYNNDYISGNSIRVASIYNHLMDDDGSYFYLDHNLNGNYDGKGVPFIDFRNDFTGRKTIVYAHSNMSGTAPFNGLQNYHNNPSYYQNNRYITVNYNGNTYTYEIFSVYVSTATDEYSDGLEYYYRMNYSDSEWNNVIQNYKNHSEYETGVSVDGNDKIIILQTCSMDLNYYEKYYRYNLLVMGKLI